MAEQQAAFEVVDVTPAMAKEWLGKLNTRNRSLRAQVVARYARDMTSGAWEFAAEPIKFGSDGTLLDGQHRLAAIRDSGCTIAMLVVNGLHMGSQDVMDTGRGRTSADQLSLAGHKSAVQLSSGIGRVIGWDLGYTQRGEKYYPTHSEIRTWLDDNPRMLHISEDARRMRSSIDLPPGITVATYFILDRLDVVEAREFMWSVARGEGLHLGDPAYALRERLREIRMARRTTDDWQYFSFTFRAWNACRRGESMRMLRATSGSGRVMPPQPI